MTHPNEKYYLMLLLFNARSHYLLIDDAGDVVLLEV